MIRTFGKVAPHAEPHFRDEGTAVILCTKSYILYLYFLYTPYNVEKLFVL